MPTIGVLSPLMGDEFFGNILLGIHRYAQQEGGRAFAIQTWPQWRQGHEWMVGEDPSVFVPYALGHVDAVISIVRAVKAEDLRRIQSGGKPIVTVCTYFPELGIPAVYPDNFAGVTELMRHLVAHGHTRIGFVGSLRNDDAIERYEAYKAALGEMGLQTDPSLFFEASDMIESGGMPAADALLAAGLPCTAVFAATDENALTIIARVQEAGYKVPSDLAVVGFDDVQRSAISNPSLTTVQQNNVALGATAARLALAQLAGADVPPRKVLVASHPVYRQSCGCWTFTKNGVARTDLLSPESRTEAFRQALVGELGGTSSPETDRDIAPIHAAAGDIAHALSTVIEGGPLPSPGALTVAWREICLGSASVEAVSRAFGALQASVEAMIRDNSCDGAVRVRAHEFMEEMRTELLNATRYPFIRRALEFETINGRNFGTSLKLLAPSEDGLHDLSWLAETLASAGCLGLWRDGGATSEIAIAGIYKKRGEHSQAVDATCTPAEFPPLDELEPTMRANPDHMLMVLPLQTRGHDWGALALLSPPEIQVLTADTGVWQWTAPLMAALARERLGQEREHLTQLLQESEQRGAQMALERERMEKEVYRSAAARLEELNRQLGETNRMKTELLEQTSAQAVAAEELARLRSDFVATVSHELRTPLAAIVGYAELLEARWDQIEDGRRLDHIRRIVAAAHRQQHMVEELLLLSRLEMGALVPDLEPIAIAGLVERAAEEVRTSYRGQKIEIDGAADLAVLADPDRTVQILVNLMDNAAKYSPDGSPIQVSWLHAGDRVAVRVHDSGSGVPVEGRDQLFTRFGRVPGSRTRAGRVGTGLGLYLGRNFAQAMGGTLELEATGPTGSVFCLLLPFAADTAPEQQVTA